MQWPILSIMRRGWVIQRKGAQPEHAACISANGADYPSPGYRPGLAVATRIRGLKARPILSIPDISFVEIHAIPFEKRSIFFLKCAYLVMFLLVIDISPQRLQIRRADRERAISVLPGELG